MHGVTIKPTITVSLTAAQWELYTWTYPARECLIAATEMNAELEYCVNARMTRGETKSRMLEVMDKFAKLGALDTEPRRHLEDILDAIYKPSIS